MRSSANSETPPRGRALHRAAHHPHTCTTAAARHRLGRAATNIEFLQLSQPCGALQTLRRFHAAMHCTALPTALLTALPTALPTVLPIARRRPWRSAYRTCAHPSPRTLRGRSAASSRAAGRVAHRAGPSLMACSICWRRRAVRSHRSTSCGSTAHRAIPCMATRSRGRSKALRWRRRHLAASDRQRERRR